MCYKQHKKNIEKLKELTVRPDSSPKSKARVVLQKIKLKKKLVPAKASGSSIVKSSTKKVLTVTKYRCDDTAPKSMTSSYIIIYKSREPFVQFSDRSCIALCFLIFSQGIFHHVFFTRCTDTVQINSIRRKV